MQTWALELQRFFTSGGSDRDARRRAIDACGDPELRVFLRCLPPRDEQTISQGIRLAQRLAGAGLSAEACVLHLNVMLPVLATAEEALRVPVAQRAALAEHLNALTGNCRMDASLRPSLALMLGITGDFCRATRAFDAARAAYEEARDTHRELAHADPRTYRNDLARTLNNLGNFYRETRAFNAARTALEEARDIRRELARMDPQTYRNNLATTLNNLGNLYRDTRVFDAARTALEEARDIRRELVRTDPQIDRSALAATLNDLGALYLDTRAFADARTALEEAREIYQELARRDYRSDLAHTLGNLGNLYSNTRAFADARTAYEEAREICRELVRTDPQTYRSGLAIILTNLGDLYRDMRAFDDARATLEEAREIYQTLARTDPRTYRSGLARTLANLGNLYRDMRAFAAARTVYEEAREIYQKLARRDPKTYRNDFAGTLTDLGILYRDTRAFDAARTALEEARDIRKELVGTDSQIYQNDLARTLTNLGSLYRDTRAFAAARTALEEAREIRRELARMDPQPYRNDLAATLDNLGNLYREERAFADARTAFEEAREIYQELTHIDQTYRRNLATTLNNLGNLYHDTRAFADARTAFEEAREIYQKLTRIDQTYRRSLATTLNNLGNLYHDTRAFADARIALDEARKIYQDLARTDPQTYRSDLADTLNNLGALYYDTRAFADARAALEKAREILRKLVGTDSQIYQSDLAQTLTNLGNLYRDTGVFADARVACEEAVRLVEASGAEGTPLSLGKGNAVGAYYFLLSQTAQTDPIKSLAYAAALRNGETVSSAWMTEALLSGLQGVLKEAAKAHGNPIALLIANQGKEAGELVLGAVTGSACDWFLVQTKGWEALFDRSDQARRADLARRIWQALPGPIQALLAPDSSNSHTVLISGGGYWSAFPWELLRFGDGPEDYLGLKCPLPRIGSILADHLRPYLFGTRPETPAGTGNHRMAVIAPHTTGLVPLAGVVCEVEALRDLIPATGGELICAETGEAAHDRLLLEAIEERPAVLYFSGHGDIVNNEEFLILHKDPTPEDPRENKVYFGAYHLHQLASETGRERLFDQVPLIMLNSCMTGRPHAHGGRREDLVQEFLHQGAAAVVATALPIYDSVGEALGKAMFSEDALSGPTLGDWIATVRRQLARDECADIQSPKWGAWAMVHLHGNAFVAPPLSGKK